jgi:hypothetical protein
VGRNQRTVNPSLRLWGFESLLFHKWVGRIAAIAAGCNPALFGVRRFESYSAHYNIYDMKHLVNIETYLNSLGIPKIPEMRQIKKYGNDYHIDFWAHENEIFDLILPNLFRDLKIKNYEPTFIIQEHQVKHTVVVSKIKPPKKIKLEKGYHYSHQDNKVNILRNGLIPKNSLDPKFMVDSVFSNGKQNGLYIDERVYFFLERDDYDAKKTFGENLDCYEVDLSDVILYVDPLYIGDEDEIVAVYTNYKIDSNRLKLL